MSEERLRSRCQLKILRRLKPDAVPILPIPVIKLHRDDKVLVPLKRQPRRIYNCKDCS